MHLIGSQSENGVSQDLHMFQPPGYGHRLIGNPKVNSWIGNSVFVTVWILTRSCCARASGHFGGLCVFDQFLRLDRHHHFKNAKGNPLEKQDLMFSPAKTFWRSFEERWSMRHVDSYRPNYRQSNTLLKRGCCWRFQRQMKVFKKSFFIRMNKIIRVQSDQKWQQQHFSNQLKKPVPCFLFKSYLPSAAMLKSRSF